MWPFRRLRLETTTWRVSTAAFASPNVNAAVLLLPTTSAIDSVSRRRRSRELARS